MPNPALQRTRHEGCYDERERGRISCVKRYWELIAARLSASGLSWGCSSEIDVTTGQVLYTADAYRKDGKQFTVIADDRLTAFLELQRVTRESFRSQNTE